MNEKSNELTLRAKLDQVEEDRERSRIKKEAIKQQMVRKYNKRVNPEEFEKGDLVLRKVELQRKPQGEGKLVPNWELLSYMKYRKRSLQNSQVRRKGTAKDMECVLPLKTF